MNALTSRLYEKKIIKLHKKIYAKLSERLQIFLANPNHPFLNNHKLSGARKNQRSIDITGDYRLIYEQLDADIVLLIDVDTHHNLYGS